MRKGEVKNFDYIGDAQVITLPRGEYKIECWGAGNTSDGTARGAYACGIFSCNKKEDVYIYVGGQGTEKIKTDNSPNGGFNGGGDGGIVSGYKYRGNGGNGATDVRVGGSDLSNRIIVAGGAGGGTDGHGGAPNGTNGRSSKYSSYYSNGGGGATQSSGGSGGTTSGTSNYAIGSGFPGSLGQGGQGGEGKYHSTYNYAGAGGGGGYYGGGGSGGGGYWCGGSNSGGGGSSYIGGVTSGKMISGANSMSSPSGGKEVGHSGAGYCRITCIEVFGLNAKCKVNGEIKNVSSMKIKVNGVWKEVSELKSKINGEWK